MDALEVALLDLPLELNLQGFLGCLFDFSFLHRAVKWPLFWQLQHSLLNVGQFM